MNAPLSPPATQSLEIVAWAITLLIAIFDASLPQGYAVGVLYVGVILLGLWIPRRAFAFQYATAVTVFAALGVFLVDGDRALGLFNHAMSVGALWVTAAGIRLFRNASGAQQVAEERLHDDSGFAELGRMAAAVAHEMRNALTGVDVALQLMQESRDDPRRPLQDDDMVLTEVRQRLASAFEVVTDLVAFAEMSGPVRSPTPIRQILDDAIYLARSTPACAHVTFGADVPAVLVDVDRPQLARVFFNVLLNSAQAMRAPGQVAISGTAHDGRLSIEVADRGAGLSQSAWAHVFEPFFSTKTRGVGLGLAFAKRVLDAHGGTIDLTSPGSGGTVVTVTLPLIGSGDGHRRAAKADALTRKA